MRREYRFEKYDLSAIKEWAKRHRLRCVELATGDVEVKLATKGDDVVGYMDVCEILNNVYFDEDASGLFVRCLDRSCSVFAYSDHLGGALDAMKAKADEFRSNKKKEKK